MRCAYCGQQRSDARSCASCGGPAPDIAARVKEMLLPLRRISPYVDDQARANLERIAPPNFSNVWIDPRG